jgi:hypothetical protein
MLLGASLGLKEHQAANNRDESRGATLEFGRFPGFQTMNKAIAYLIAPGIIFIGPAQAQGISNQRDASGNLVDRGATTRTYPSTPMANSHITAPPTHGYIARISHHHAIVTQNRR